MNDKPWWDVRVTQADVDRLADRVLTAERSRDNAQAEIERLRAMLWQHHGHDGLYSDDGEMQCNMHGSPVDFRRDSLDRIEVHLHPYHII